MSQQRSNKSNISVRDLSPTDVVNRCVKFIICCEGSKKPIRQIDIEKYLDTVCQTPYDKKAVIENANTVLKSVYGYKLVQIKSKGIQYIVVLNDKCESIPSTYSNPYHRKLLVAALTHIYMSGGAVRDIHMWDFLSKAKLLEENDQAGRKILTNTFRKQLYLEYNKIDTDDQTKYEFKWGLRADEELPKEFILNKMAQAFDKEPNYWKEQHKLTQDAAESR